jgi:hypothetical protein
MSEHPNQQQPSAADEEQSLIAPPQAPPLGERTIRVTPYDTVFKTAFGPLLAPGSHQGGSPIKRVLLEAYNDTLRAVGITASESLLIEGRINIDADEPFRVSLTRDEFATFVEAFHGTRRPLRVDGNSGRIANHTAPVDGQVGLHAVDPAGLIEETALSAPSRTDYTGTLNTTGARLAAGLQGALTQSQAFDDDRIEIRSKPKSEPVVATPLDSSHEYLIGSSHGAGGLGRYHQRDLRPVAASLGADRATVYVGGEKPLFISDPFTRYLAASQRDN